MSNTVYIVGPQRMVEPPPTGGYGHGWRILFQSGGEQVHVKETIENFCGLNEQL